MHQVLDAIINQTGSAV